MRFSATNWRAAVLWLFLSLAGGAGVAHAASRAQKPPGKSSPYIAYATWVKRAPRLDGTLDDPIWQQAKPIVNFRQREPFQGQPATEKTVVRIVYTAKEIYFGILCYDPHPRDIVATDLRRDADLHHDDHFVIAIDPTLSRRDAFIFEVNPLGTRRDGLVVNEGHFDNGWNGIWTSSARITRKGWSATIGIPFFTVLQQSGDIHWGINFERFIRRENEVDMWAAWQREFGVLKVGQEGELIGVHPIHGSRLLVIKPYVVAGFRHLPANLADTALGQPGMNMRHAAGANVMLGLRSNVVMNFTVNPSFATAGVDTTQFSLSPYPLYFPEKRQFFLENAGVFNFPTNFGSDRLFFSRQIGIDSATGDQVPVNGGAKITGTLDGFDFGAMEVETRGAGPDPWANYGVVRLKKSLWGASYVGVMGIDKRSGSATDPYNQSGGVDTRLVFHKNIDVTAFAAATRSPGLVGGDTNVGAGLQYNNSWLSMEISRRRVGVNYNPEVGFLERNDCHCNYMKTTFKPRPKIRGIRELDFGGTFEHDTTIDLSQLETQTWKGTIEAQFNNGGHFAVDVASATAQQITEAFDLYKNIQIQPGLYRWMRHRFEYLSGRDRPVTYDLSDEFGGYYDGRLNSAQAKVSYRANEHWQVGLNQQWNRFRMPEGNFSVAFGGLSLDYAFSRFFSVSSLVQMNTANTQAASAYVLLRWHYRPDSDFYLIYTAGPRFSSIQGTTTATNQQEFIVKFTYSLNPCHWCKRGLSGRNSQLPAAVDSSQLLPVRAPRPLTPYAGGGPIPAIENPMERAIP